MAVAAAMAGTGPGLRFVAAALFHADAETVLQLVESSEAAAVERLIPQAPERLPRRPVVAAEQPCRPLHCLCLVQLAHRRLLFRDSGLRFLLAQSARHAARDH